jgi:hypothetical protein
MTENIIIIINRNLQDVINNKLCFNDLVIKQSTIFKKLSDSVHIPFLFKTKTIISNNTENGCCKYYFESNL